MLHHTVVEASQFCFLASIMSSLAFVVTPASPTKLGVNLFSIFPTEFLLEVWHAVLASFPDELAGNNCWPMTKDGGGVRWKRSQQVTENHKKRKDENHANWYSASKSSIKIDSSVAKENRDWGADDVPNADGVCRCSWLFTFEQGWHNCHIPVPIRCPPQLRGLRKLGPMWGSRGGIEIAASAEIAWHTHLCIPSTLCVCVCLKCRTTLCSQNKSIPRRQRPLSEEYLSFCLFHTIGITIIIIFIITTIITIIVINTITIGTLNSPHHHQMLFQCWQNENFSRWIPIW